MYISPYIVQTLHEDRIRDAQQYARNRFSDQPSVSLFSRINGLLLRVRPQHPIRDARHAHAI